MAGVLFTFLVSLTKDIKNVDTHTHTHCKQNADDGVPAMLAERKTNIQTLNCIR